MRLPGPMILAQSGRMYAFVATTGLRFTTVSPDAFSLCVFVSRMSVCVGSGFIRKQFLVSFFFVCIWTITLRSIKSPACGISVAIIHYFRFIRDSCDEYAYF